VVLAAEAISCNPFSTITTANRNFEPNEERIKKLATTTSTRGS